MVMSQDVKRLRQWSYFECHKVGIGSHPEPSAQEMRLAIPLRPASYIF